MIVNKRFQWQTKVMRIVTLLLMFSSIVLSQSWERNDVIFNPSGIPSLSFSQPRFADLDSDGDFDLILGSIDKAPFYFENAGTPTSPSFHSGANIFEPVSSLDAEMGICVDIDADADLDFITGGYTGLHLFVNIGSESEPEFVESENYFQAIDCGNNPVPAFADLDSDGDYDLLIGLSEDGKLKFYLNTGTPDSAVFSESQSQIFYDVGLYAYPWFADLDSDNDFDLLAGRDVTGFYYYRNNGDSTNWQWQSVNTVFGGIAQSTYWNSPCLVDLTGDGKLDLVYGTAAGPLNYYKNTGSASSPSWIVNTSLFGGVLDVGGASSPDLFDFDYDGDLDLISGSQLGGTKYYRNIGSATAAAWEPDHQYFNSIYHPIYSAVAIGDVNGDSLPDAVAGDLNGELFFHKNTGSGFTHVASTFSGIDLGYCSAPALTDMDYDGDLDIVAGNEDGNLFYFENTGTSDSASWSEVPGYFGDIDVGMDCVPTAGDFDNDGDIDIVTGDIFHEIQYFEHVDSQWVENSAVVAGISADQNAAPGFGDLDGDGDLDLTIGNYDGTFSYYENTNPSSVDSPGDRIELEFRLLPVYPNPFNSATTFKGEIPAKGIVELSVFNMLGQRIYYRRQVQREAGYFQMNLEFSDRQPAGVYCYILSYVNRSGCFNRTGKVVYLK